MKKPLTTLCATLLLLYPLLSSASTLHSDEEIIYFRSSATWDNNTRQWAIPVHGWVFEAEHDSFWRNGTMELLKLRLGLNADDNQSGLLKERGWPFLVDNERGKAITVQLGAQRQTLSSSEGNGHFHGELALASNKNLMRQNSGRWVSFDTLLPQNDKRRFEGSAQLVGTHGLSVISDIDDTIKHSHVLDRKELLKNTFLRDFKAISGMAKRYQQWEKQGAVFHYVTGSPWQLYPALRDFCDGRGFPRGSFAMRHFRVKDGSLIDFLGASFDYKLNTIDTLLSRYPKRQFILVGDSGEKDPEVYGEIARRHPQQVRAIYIHNVTEEKDDSQRFRNAFASLPATRWKLFDNAQELEANL